MLCIAHDRAEQPTARVEAVQLDLTDLESVRSFANKALDAGRALDVLINNAGGRCLPCALPAARQHECVCAGG